MVQVLDLDKETMTCGSLYNFAMLNSPETGYLGKKIISPNWWNQSHQTYGVGMRTYEETSVQNFKHIGVVISEIM